MTTKRFTLFVLALIVVVTMTGCFDNKASQPGIWYNPFSWGNQTAEQTAAEILSEAQAQKTIRDAEAAATAMAGGVPSIVENPAATVQVCTVCQVTQTSVPAPTATVSIPATPEKPLIDQFGPENAFPGTGTTGLAEVYDPSTEFCATIKINSNEQLVWTHSGAWWAATGGQAALDARWPHHVKEYQQKYDHCKVYHSVLEFLAANPTYK